MNWLHYLLEANIYLGVFYLCYCLFLKNETHYNLSRIYLLLGCILSFVLPVTQLSILKPAETVISDRPVALVPANLQVYHPAPSSPPVMPGFILQDGLIYAYIIGAAIALVIFVFRLYQLFKLTRGNPLRSGRNYQIIQLKDESTAFSFFKYLFIGSNIIQSKIIIAHELVHIRQKHSWDIMLLEILKVINWFNPFIYLTQRGLKTVHEYIADEQTAAHEQDALTYSSFLLNNAYGIPGSAMAHSFFNYNLLKKRIIMLNQKRSGKLARLKYLAVLPLCAGMLGASTLVFAKDYGLIDLVPQKKVPVIATVIDSTRYTLQLTAPDGTKGVSDIVVVENKKSGFKRTYTVNSLTEKDKKELENKGFYIAIIARETPQQDTINKKLPPPPPVPPTMVKPDKSLKKAALEKTDPKNYQENKSMTDLFNYLSRSIRVPKKAHDLKTEGRVIVTFNVNGKKLEDVKVVRSLTPEIDNEVVRALNSFKTPIALSPDYHYSIPVLFRVENGTSKQPVAANGEYPLVSNNYSKGSNLSLNEVVIATYSNEPAKTSPSAPRKISKMSQPVGVPDKSVEAPIEKDLQAVSQINKRPPPPIPYDPIYENLIKHMSQTTRYPAIAYEKKVNGHVILSMNMNKDHKITDIKVEKGIGSGCDEEAVRALKTYNKVIDKSPGTYKIAITFFLLNNDNTKFYTPKALGSDLVDKHNFIGQVMIAGYIK